MAYEIWACASCGNREPMDLPREDRFAGAFGPLCDDCLPPALLVAEANAANAPTDPALLALARFGACIANEYHRGKYGFVSADGGWLDIDAASTGVKEYQGAAEFAPGIASAIAALLATDGADGAGV